MKLKSRAYPKEKVVEEVENRSSDSPGKRMVTALIVAAAVLLLGNLVVRMSLRAGWLPSWVVAVIAFVSVLPLVWFALSFFRLLRSDLDELVQRVALEGMAFALVVFVPIAGLYVNARAAGLAAPPLDSPESLLALPLLVAVGILRSWGRLK